MDAAMRLDRRMIATSWLFLVCLAVCLPAQAQRASVSMGEWRKKSLSHRAGHENQVLHERDATLGLGTVAYKVAYKAGLDENEPGKAFPVEGYIGMPGPSSCNWYHGGFLAIIVNGRDIGGTPLSSMVTAESGDRAIVDMVWHAEDMDVRVRFLGLPDHDHVFCEVAVDAPTPPKSLVLKLRCYPSFFTSWHKRKGARRIQTPSTLVKEGERTTVAADANEWAVYYDEVFDVERGEGEGPCAMLLVPGDAAEIAFAPGDYAVETTVTCQPEARRVRLAFWDFKGKTNAAALDRLRDGGEAVLKELRGLDFTPKPVQAFDAGAVRAHVAEALESASVRKTLGKRLESVQAWLEQCAPAAAVQASTASIKAQEAILKSMDDYHDFIWEIKLAELLDDL